MRRAGQVLVTLVAMLSAASSASGAPEATLLKGGLWKRSVTARDGTSLTLYRYVPAVPRAGRPVLMVPELGFTRDVFDVEGEGLAPYLQLTGREVFVLEPRGHGTSGPGHRLAEIVEQDVPAAIAEVNRLTREAPDLVGHGFAGSLLVAATAGADPGTVHRIIAIATPIEPSVPNSRMEAALASDRAFGADAETFEFLFHRTAKIASQRLARVRESTSRALSPGLRRDWREWMQSGDLRLGGEGDSVKRRLERLTRPTYLILPLLDYVAHPEYAAPLRELHPELVEIRILSKLYLHAEDYTHLSVLLGEGAESDVFTPMLRFLERP